MKKIAGLIDRVLAAGEDAPRAAGALATGSEDAAPAMRKAILRGGPGARLLAAALIDREGAVDLDFFAELTRATDRHVAGTAVDALASSHDPRAVAPLAAHLTGGLARAAIIALGDLRHPDAIAPLHGRLERCLGVVQIDRAAPSARVRPGGDWAELEHLPHLIGALARLGDDRALPLLAPCLHAASDDDEGYDDPREIHREAIAAMRWAVVPGMVAPLRDAARAPSTELAEYAIEALFLLGAPVAVDAIAAVEPGEPGGPRALLRLNDLLGRTGGKDAARPALLTRWAKLRSSFEPTVCVRNGAPINLASLAAAVDDERLRWPVLEELAIITGETFGHEPKLGRRTWVDYPARVRAWMASHVASYPPGVAHKAGRPIDLAAAVA